MNKNILSKEGYLLRKKNNETIINQVKEELTVSPFMSFKKLEKPDTFPVYLENDKYLCVPKYYGLKKFGKPNKNKELDGKQIDIEFKGNLRQNQLEISDTVLSKIQSDDGGLLSLQCGGGKCLARDTEVLMYDGTICKVQDIIVGDKIMGDDSNPRNILSLARGQEIMYRISNTNSSYIVNESHILSLTDDLNKIDMSLKEYLRLVEQDIELFGYRVPITFYERELEFDPYLLGLWLGNNNDNSLINLTKINIKNDEMFKYIVKYFKLNFQSLYLKPIKEKYYIIKTFINFDPFIYFLRKYNLINNKNIPKHYKCNSRKNQLLLLAGIIDAKGIYDNNKYIITEINIRLLNDIIYLTRSLGFNVNIINRFEIHIHGFQIPVLSLPIIYTNQNSLNYKIKIEKLEINNYYGFEIDGNRRFVLGDFSVTHNTVIALYIASQLKVKTLVIVHKSFLLNQWLLRAKEFTSAKVGIIQQNKIDIEGNDIVIGMLQSIAKDKYDTDIFRDFGLVIFDEAHHAPSKYFSRALPIIACKKTLALSATPNRTDKLEKVLYWYFGDVLYKAPTETINNVLVKIIKYNITHPHFKEYKQNYGQEINRPKTINKIFKIDIRNTFIIDTINDILKEEHRKLIILSDRVEHLEILKKLLDNIEENNISTSFYIGGLKQKVLDEAEKAQVIFATYSMAAEALDIPELNTLLMVTPRTEVEQAVGRITRKKDHPVQPLIIDIVDQLPSFVRQGYNRRRFYNKKKFATKLIEIEENEIINETCNVINTSIINTIDEEDSNDTFID